MTVDSETRQRIRRLALRLIQSTAAGTARWSETDADDEYLWAEPASSILISRKPDYSLRVTVITTSEDAPETIDVVPPSGPLAQPEQKALYATLDELHRAARYGVPPRLAAPAQGSPRASGSRDHQQRQRGMLGRLPVL